MLQHIDPRSRLCFYQAAASGLRALDAIAGKARRFGEGPDANWKAFHGELRSADRLDLLLRDAAVLYPAAFAPRVVFSLQGLAEDEPFGPEWEGLGEEDASLLLRGQREPASTTMGDLLAGACRLWGVMPKPLPQEALQGLGPATRILAAGAGSVASLAALFASRPEMDLADQVVLLTDAPGERQLFGLAGAFLATTRPLRILNSRAKPQDARALGLSQPNRVLISDDVSPVLRATCEALGRELVG